MRIKRYNVSTTLKKKKTSGVRQENQILFIAYALQETLTL